MSVQRPEVRIFQICYSEQTLQQVPPGMHALDNVSNLRSDWREYWPIRHFLLNQPMEDDVFYGFFSPRFPEKTGLDLGKIERFLDQHYQGQEVILFSPFWDLGAFFVNVIEQGEFFHPGLRQATQEWVQGAGLPARLMDAVMHSGNTVFCNYFLAKKAFWLQWLSWGESLFAMAEQRAHDPQCVLNGGTPYGGGTVARKVFVMERIVSLLLAAQPTIKTLAYDTYRLPSSITPFNRFKDEAVQCDAYKQAWMLTQSQAALAAFSQTRDRISRAVREILSTEFK